MRATCAEEVCADADSSPLADVRAVLFDSGGVLMQPIGGRWHPRADFEPTILTRAPWITPEQFARAIAAGDRFFAASRTTPGDDAYHRVLLADLNLAATPRLLADLRRQVAPDVVLETFSDVHRTLRELRRRGVRMAVVSDAWPNLPELHAGLGIAEFFEAYAISSVLGCRKPDPRMYHHASDALGLRPGQCVFIDDDPELVAAATDLGYVGCALRRAPSAEAASAPESAASRADVPVITSLDQLLELF